MDEVYLSTFLQDYCGHSFGSNIAIWFIHTILRNEAFSLQSN